MVHTIPYVDVWGGASYGHGPVHVTRASSDPETDTNIIIIFTPANCHHRHHQHLCVLMMRGCE